MHTPVLSGPAPEISGMERRPPPTPPPAPAPPPPAGPLRFLPLVPLLLSIAAAGTLSLTSIAGIQTPGCGPASGCEHAAASPWGHIPFPGLTDGWPVSHAGLAYFLAMFVACAVQLFPRRRVRIPLALQCIAGVSALASLAFMGAMAWTGLWCAYCLGAHAGNLAFVALLERSELRGKQSPALARRDLAAPIGAFAGVLALATGVLALGQARAGAKAEEAAAKVVESLRNAPAEPGGGDDDGFVGRYSLGPADAPVRIVVFTDYRCPDCRAFEAILSPVVAAHEDVRVSARLFPLDSTCNPSVPRTLHSGACEDALAAEAAGILAGPEGFWKMHRLLFARGPSPSPDSLDAAWRDIGVDPYKARETMRSPDALARLRTDLDDAAALGIYRTPAVFVNGIELTAWNVPGALERAVSAAAIRAAELGPSETERRPPSALERFVAEWREQPMAALPSPRRSLGAEDPRVWIFVFGDYQVAGTRDADVLLRSIVSARTDAAYAYLHFPMDKKCNPVAPRTASPLACRMARTAEGAGLLGGDDAYWAVHDWILQNRQVYNDIDLKRLATSLGIDGATLVASKDRAETASLVGGDCAAGGALLLPEIPAIFVNGRRVVRWKSEGVDSRLVLERIVEEAAAASTGPKRR